MARSVEERRRRIVDIVAQEGPQNARRLATRLGVSAVTLRRDLEHLASVGSIRRRHGTVEPLGAPSIAGPDAPTIGLVLPESNYYYDGIIAGAKRAAGAAGAKLVLGVSDYRPEKEIHQAERLITKGVDGLVMAPTPDFATGWLVPSQEERLAQLRVPTVFVERTASPGGPCALLDTVNSAHDVGAAVGLRHLIQLGHRRITALMISGPNSPWVREGLLQASAHAGLEDPQIIMEGTPGSDEARAAVLQTIEDGTTAVFVHNDQLATRAILWLEDAGISIPDEVSLIGYDDVIAGMADVPLTALDPPKREVGRRAVERVLALCGGATSSAVSPADGGATQHIRLVPELHVRQSTTVPREPPRSSDCRR
ncbi:MULTISPECIES: substrate-binding domain-containing protein [Actinomycetes]|uniref:Substrate-binding domain-containing protein n=2 Tax=Actinomycetes TaxID=1760 RepID=A0ABP6M5R4_9MICC